MRKLLIVITRMHAKKGTDGDEFLGWCAEQEVDREHLLYPQQPDDYGPLVLLIHGHDYPPHEQAVGRAAAAIMQAVSEELMEAMETGVAFHRPLSWGNDEVQAFERELWTGLNGTGHNIKFVRAYSGDLPLSALCRNRRGISAEFDKQWRAFLTRKSDFDTRLGHIDHKIVNQIGGLDKELQAWKESNFETGYGRTMLESYGGGVSQAALEDARRRVVSSWWYGDTAFSVIEALLLEPDTEGKKGTIRKKFEKLKGHFDEANADYRRVEEIVALFASAQEANVILQTLKSILAEKNHFGSWYASLHNAFRELRDTVREWSGG